MVAGVDSVCCGFVACGIPQHSWSVGWYSDNATPIAASRCFCWEPINVLGVRVVLLAYHRLTTVPQSLLGISQSLSQWGFSRYHATQLLPAAGGVCGQVPVTVDSGIPPWLLC